MLKRFGVPTCMLDGQARIQVANSPFIALLGLSEAEVHGRTWQNLAHRLVASDGGVIVDPLFPLGRQVQQSSEPLLFGYQQTSKSPVLWLQVYPAQAIPGHTVDSHELVSFGDVTRLMTEQRTSFQVLQAKSEWEATVDALQDIVTIQDGRMRIVRANKAAHEMFGFRLGELKGKRCYEAFMGRDKPCGDCPVVTTLQDGRSHTGTVHLGPLEKTFSISALPILGKQGELHQVVHVARDITGYLRNAQEKNRMMAAIEQTSESVVITDGCGVIVYVNPAFEEASGYGREEAVGQSANIVKSGNHDAAFYNSMWQTLRMKKVWRGRLVNRRKNGAIYKEDATISPVLDSAGTIVNYVAIKRDVTREEQLERQLLHGLKMEALGTLVGGIAHDFNNILSAMIGYTEMAKDRLPPEHPALRDLSQVIAGGDRAVDLVKQILTFSREESYGQFRVFRVQYLIKETIKLLRPSLPATIKLTHDIDVDCRSVFADPGQIYQVVMNLCTNAIQSIGKNHGELHLRLREIRHNAPIGAINGQPGSGAYLELEVRDTGCGIAEENLGRIFDPFFSTKQKEQGTGLGLAVVHGIIKKHKGEIHVESSPGRGSSFFVYLAIDGREEQQVTEQPVVYVGGDERIMVVDDERPIVEVLASLLGKRGYQVNSFVDPLAAVRFFRENPDCCDLVLTDMIMPNMTGAELAREFLRLRPELPIVMFTGHSDNIDHGRAVKLGIRELLLKPVKAEKLWKTVRNVLNNG